MSCHCANLAIRRFLAQIIQLMPGMDQRRLSPQCERSSAQKLLQGRDDVATLVIELRPERDMEI